MLSKFGDIPWVEMLLTVGKSLSFMENVIVVTWWLPNILSNLKYAETHIGSNIEADGKNTINMYVVKALISRFALFEGTWRKYHGLSGADTYLEELCPCF